jgi:hypothetical protein
MKFNALFVIAPLINTMAVVSNACNKAMNRFSELPLTLYRIQPRFPVNLRPYDVQMSLGRTSFDLKTHDGFVKPIEQGTPFRTPNGMSLRPASDTMVNILEKFRGEPTIYTLLTGTQLPKGLCIYHEHTDHYSLQTTERITLPEFNHKLTEFLESLPSMTKQDFLAQMDDINDQDC